MPKPDMMNSMMGKNMNERMSVQQIGFPTNHMMTQSTYDTNNMGNNYMSHNPQMYMSSRGPMTGRMLNTYGINDLQKTENGQEDSQKDSNKTGRGKSKKKSTSKRNIINKSKSRTFKSKIN